MNESDEEESPSFTPKLKTEKSVNVKSTKPVGFSPPGKYNRSTSEIKTEKHHIMEEDSFFKGMQVEQKGQDSERTTKEILLFEKAELLKKQHQSYLNDKSRKKLEL